MEHVVEKRPAPALRRLGDDRRLTPVVEVNRYGRVDQHRLEQRRRGREAVRWHRRSGRIPPVHQVLANLQRQPDHAR